MACFKAALHQYAVIEWMAVASDADLSAVVDLFNGEILAYATSRSPLFTMVGAMLNRAFAKLRPGDRPILHSDQGWQYQMEQ